MSNHSYAIPKEKINCLLVSSTSPYTGITRLSYLNHSQDIVDWLIEMTYRREVYNHPENEAGLLNEVQLSVDSLNTGLYIHDFTNSLTTSKRTLKTIVDALSNIANDYFLIIFPICDKVGECYAAAYISIQLFDSINAQNPNIFSQLNTRQDNQ